MFARSIQNKAPSITLNQTATYFRFSPVPGYKVVSVVKDARYATLGECFRENSGCSGNAVLLPAENIPEDIADIMRMAEAEEGLQRNCSQIALCPTVVVETGDREEQEIGSLTFSEERFIPEPFKGTAGRNTIFINLFQNGSETGLFQQFYALTHETGHLEFFNEHQPAMAALFRSSQSRSAAWEFFASAREWNAMSTLLQRLCAGHLDASGFSTAQKIFESNIPACSGNLAASYNVIKLFGLAQYFWVENLPLPTPEESHKFIQLNVFHP